MRHALHDLAEKLEVDVGVTKHRARPVARLLGEGELHGRVVATPRRAVGQRLIEVGAKTRGVGQEVADGDLVAPAAVELGQVAAYAVVEMDLAALDEEPDGGR